MNIYSIIIDTKNIKKNENMHIVSVFHSQRTLHFTYYVKLNV